MPYLRTSKPYLKTNLTLNGLATCSHYYFARNYVAAPRALSGNITTIAVSALIQISRPYVEEHLQKAIGMKWAQRLYDCSAFVIIIGGSLVSGMSIEQAFISGIYLGFFQFLISNLTSCNSIGSSNIFPNIKQKSANNSAFHAFKILKERLQRLINTKKTDCDAGFESVVMVLMSFGSTLKNESWRLHIGHVGTAVQNKAQKKVYKSVCELNREILCQVSDPIYFSNETKFTENVRLYTTYSINLCHGLYAMQAKMPPEIVIDSQIKSIFYNVYTISLATINSISGVILFKNGCRLFDNSHNPIANITELASTELASSTIKNEHLIHLFFMALYKNKLFLNNQDNSDHRNSFEDFSDVDRNLLINICFKVVYESPIPSELQRVLSPLALLTTNERKFIIESLIRRAITMNDKQPNGFSTETKQAADNFYPFKIWRYLDALKEVVTSLSISKIEKENLTKTIQEKMNVVAIPMMLDVVKQPSHSIIPGANAASVA